MSAWRDPTKQQQQDSSSLMADYNNGGQPTAITTPIPSSSPSDSESADKNSASNIECVVCGDKSSGKHYGQYTCEGCKSFFKRSVRRNLTYQCRGNKNCPIDQHHRNQCQYCRLKKCLKNGMRKEAVQRGRIANQGMLSAQYPFVNCGVNGSFGYRESASSYISQLMRADTYVQPDLTRYYGVYAGTNLTAGGISDTAAQILMQSITWCRSIPFFSDLPPNDRWSLVKHSWSDLFLLTAAQQSSLTGQSFIAQFLTAQNLSTSTAATNYQVYQSYTLIQDRIDKLRSLHLDAVEYNCLKAIALYSTDAPQLSDPSYIEMIQEKSQCALEEYIRTRLEYGGPNSTRAGRLLLRLPSLRAINSPLLESLFFSRLMKPVNLDHLLRELLLNGSSNGGFGAWSAYGMTPALTAC